jgi:two-component system chemotaxis sensor kinase CheA
MSDLLVRINKTVEEIALELVTLDEQDIPALGNILNKVTELEESSREIGQAAFLDLILAIKGYLEKVILREKQDLTPLEEGIDGLQIIYSAIINQEVFEGDMSLLLEKLGYEKPKPTASNEEIGGRRSKKARAKGATQAESPRIEIDEDEKEIIEDFIMESLDNLGSVEVSVVDLEQDPEDSDTINAIFRPFHTIKGVSGFIKLDKINKLAHSTENLLDKAREGEIRIEGGIIDIILESVDMLKKMIEGVREGLENGTSLDCGLDIAPLVDRIDGVLSQLGQGNQRLGDILVQKDVITRDDLEEAVERQRIEPDRKIGEILLEERKVVGKDVVSALRQQKKAGPQHVELQVKVDTRKLDSLVDLTGELVIAQSMLRQNPWIVSANDQGLFHTISHLTQITSSLQTTAMSIRMVPIRNTFQKMVRLVRDTARNLGKEVELKMTGEDTEIDRNMVEELYDPLVHMIRNAVDHGIETPEQREKAGKDRKGNIHLQAYHRGGNIIVEIQDDGRGLHTDKIIEKARSTNLISDDVQMTESEIYNLIFHPGFSTAKDVTEISGRGVGMDVVKKAIERLRGRVEIHSSPGRGSTFLISLPLTLAILEGMVVRIGGQRYIIPTLAVVESFRPEKSEYSTVKGKGEMITSRGNLLPLVRLDRLFGEKGDSVQPWEALVVAVEHEGRQLCLLLNELLGKEEVVIKSLGESIKNTKGIAGGAIMGDGRVALILDIAGIAEEALNN